MFLSHSPISFIFWGGAVSGLVELLDRSLYASAQYDLCSHHRLNQLANWMASHSGLGTSVVGLLSSSPAHPRRKDLWKPYLYANYCARELLAKRMPDIHQLAVSIPQRIDCGAGIDVVGASVPVAEDLDSASHPLVEGSQFRPVADAQMIRTCAEVASHALDLLYPHSVSHALVTHHCAAICFIEAIPQLGPGQCLSSCSRITPGIIYISAAPTILTAESIVHESAHQLLYAICESHDLVIDNGAKIVTPLRSDPRPMIGLLHQVWVLYHLVQLYEFIALSSAETVARNRQKVLKRRDLHREDFSIGYEQLIARRDLLTPAGRAIVAHIGRLIHAS